MDAAQSLLQKTSPADLEKNIQGFQKILSGNPDAVDSLLKKHLVPFQVCTAEGMKGERPFLLCRYNQKDENTYRSPWTGRWHSYPNDPKKKSEPTKDEEMDEEFRWLELTTNEVWDAYKNLYYGQESVGSVYLRDTSDKKGRGAFQGLFGVFKQREGVGSWHSVSQIYVDEPGEETCNYRVETSVIVVVDPGTPATGPTPPSDLRFDISASLSKELSRECKLIPNMLMASHIENMGELIETNEMELRSQLERVLIPKAVELVDPLMKEKEKSTKPAVNPLMGMIMGSDVLKKKMAK